VEAMNTALVVVQLPTNNGTLEAQVRDKLLTRYNTYVQVLLSFDMK